MGQASACSYFSRKNILALILSCSRFALSAPAEYPRTEETTISSARITISYMTEGTGEFKLPDKMDKLIRLEAACDEAKERLKNAAQMISVYFCCIKEKG